MDPARKVETFPLTLSEIGEEYRRLPSDFAGILYHYTDKEGLEGICRSGGFRATHRLKMNDEGEFAYAKQIVVEALDSVGRASDLPRIARDLVQAYRTNLDRLERESTGNSSAYCACFSFSRDQKSQWRRYADRGNGFLLGIDFMKLMKSQCPNVKEGLPFFWGAPVIYDSEKQRELIQRLCESAIQDLQKFAKHCSASSDDLTAMYRRIQLEGAAQMVVLIDLIKHPDFASENEFRVMIDSNSGSSEVTDVKQYERNGASFPYLFFDFRGQITGRLPLREIVVGPNAPFEASSALVAGLLDELGYGNGHDDRPVLSKSLVTQF